MASSASKVLLFLNGLIGLKEAKSLYLDDGSVNFYPVQDGYLQNYPGRTDYFDRTKGDPGATDTWGVPPPVATEYTKVTSFIDYLGIEHLVFVKGDSLCETQSNGFRVLYTFIGDNIAGKYYPTLFIHLSKLIILNGNDTPLIWDGVDGVTPLGVQEVPDPPLNVETQHLYPTNFALAPFYTKGNVWYHWEEGVIRIGPSKRTDGTNPCNGWYKTVVQFIDKYGNHGRASAPSEVFVNQLQGPGGVEDQKAHNATWNPPFIDDHIHYVRQGRTLTLNPDDEFPAGKDTEFYTEVYYQGTSCCRATQRLTDTGLSANTAIDIFVGPPPAAPLGASFAGRIFVLDQENLVWFSDLVLFGQFRSTQTFKPYSNVTAIVPAGDRLFVIGESSTEVLYESNIGPALLEQDINNGSVYGSSFIAVGDGIVFGLWNEGFGFYDGQKHTFVNVPYYIKDYYLKTISPSASAIKINEWYYLPIKQDQQSLRNNIILMFHFKKRSWFIVEDTVYDIAYWNEEIVGVDDSLYILYRGNTFPTAVLNTAGIVIGEINEETTVTDVRLLMEPSSFTAISLNVTGEQRNPVQVGTGYAQPLKGVNIDSPNPEPYWNEPGLEYGQNWLAPGDVFLQMRHSKPVPGFYHHVKVAFTVGHFVRVKAIEVSFSRPTRPEQR